MAISPTSNPLFTVIATIYLLLPLIASHALPPNDHALTPLDRRQATTALKAGKEMAMGTFDSDLTWWQIALLVVAVVAVVGAVGFLIKRCRGKRAKASSSEEDESKRLASDGS